MSAPDLASHSRLLLYNRPKHTLLYRWLGLYPLYVLAEVAIIATDLAELLGSAIALCLLFPRLELWHGVLITAFDVIIILAMGDPLRGKPVKMFEILIAGMVSTFVGFSSLCSQLSSLKVIAVLVCMIVIISKVDVNWADAFEGYIPSKYIFASGGIYTCKLTATFVRSAHSQLYPLAVGILGATVMPHSLFLGSALATQDRISFRSKKNASNLAKLDKESEASLSMKPAKKQSIFYHFYEERKEAFLAAFRKPGPGIYASATRHGEHENNPFEFVNAHLYHGTFDMIGSLLGFAVMINSLWVSFSPIDDSRANSNLLLGS